MNARSARKIAKAILGKYGYGSVHITAKTVDFTDLARHSAVFVTVHDSWVPQDVAAKVEVDVKAAGFFIEFPQVLV